MTPRYPDVALSAGNRCEYCHAPEAAFNLQFEVEHVLPLCHRGSNTDANLALSCRSCNLRKASYIEGIDPQSRTCVRLFNPRQDKVSRSEIEARGFDLKAVNPNRKTIVDDRTPEQILDEIEARGREVAEALRRLRGKAG